MKKAISIIAVVTTMFILTMNVINNVYSRVGVVTGVITHTDTVYVVDSEGIEWTFTGCDDWEVGDGANMIMFTNMTKKIEDDEILSVKYYRWDILDHVREEVAVCHH